MVILYLEPPLAFPRVLPDGVSDRESSYQCRRCGFDPRIRKIPWSMRWNSTPVFFPGKFHGQKSLARLQSMGPQRIRHNWTTKHTAYSDITSLSLVVISQSVSSVTQSCLTLCDPINRSMPELPVHLQLYPNSCPLSWWCHPTILSSVVPFSSCLQSFPT